MLPLVTYEMIRQRDEERRTRSLKKFWWRYVEPVDAPGTPSSSIADAEVIELVFGAHCEIEEPIGA